MNKDKNKLKNQSNDGRPSNGKKAAALDPCRTGGEISGIVFVDHACRFIMMIYGNQREEI